VGPLGPEAQTESASVCADDAREVTASESARAWVNGGEQRQRGARAAEESSRVG